MLPVLSENDMAEHRVCTQNHCCRRTWRLTLDKIRCRLCASAGAGARPTPAACPTALR
jgi:hypothetical protein